MLDKKRIVEAENNIKQYLNEGLIKRIDHPEPQIIRVLVNNSRESLSVADLLLSKNYSSLWTIVCSYYSMYYIANAVLYKKGFKIGHKITHKITADALIAYVRKELKQAFIKEYEEAREEALELAGIKADQLVESYDLERMKRSRFQYTTTQEAIAIKAKTSLQRAKRFVFEMEKLIL